MRKIFIFVVLVISGCITPAYKIESRQKVILSNEQGIIVLRMLFGGKTPGITFEEKSTHLKFNISYDAVDKVPHVYKVNAGEYCLVKFTDATMFGTNGGVLTRTTFNNNTYCFNVVKGELSIAPEFYERIGMVEWVRNDERIANATEIAYPELKSLLDNFRKKIREAGNKD